MVRTAQPMRVEATQEMKYPWTMDHWLELRTAYRLAKLGTVSAAAQDLGVHRATVNRHVDIVEQALGAKLFQRHARGYTLTETGHDLLDVAHRADEMFSDLAGRGQAQAGQLSGSLLITSLSGLAPMIMPAIQKFRATHPEIDLVYSADEALARLEYGEAHVAIRAGARPKEPDYVALPFRKICFGLYATHSYIDRFGMPNPNNLTAHHFVGAIDGQSRLPYSQWMKEHVEQSQIALKTSDQNVINSAVSTGVGLGFMAEHDTQGFIEVFAPRNTWSADIWIVTHVDLHRTQKVQEFLKFLKHRNVGPKSFP
jgi:DNA-binding transcriptional LysR family regulator